MLDRTILVWLAWQPQVFLTDENRQGLLALLRIRDDYAHREGTACVRFDVTLGAGSQRLTFHTRRAGARGRVVGFGGYCAGIRLLGAVSCAYASWSFQTGACLSPKF